MISNVQCSGHNDPHMRLSFIAYQLMVATPCIFIPFRISELICYSISFRRLRKTRLPHPPLLRFFPAGAGSGSPCCSRPSWQSMVCIRSNTSRRSSPWFQLNHPLERRAWRRRVLELLICAGAAVSDAGGGGVRVCAWFNFYGALQDAATHPGHRILTHPN